MLKKNDRNILALLAALSAAALSVARADDPDDEGESCVPVTYEVPEKDCIANDNPFSIYGTCRNGIQRITYRTDEQQKCQARYGSIYPMHYVYDWVGRRSTCSRSTQECSGY